MSQSGNERSTDWIPTKKVSVGVLASSFTVLILEIARQFGWNVTAEVGAAITSIITFIVQYLIPEN